MTFAEGILTFISPCILPMLPVYFIYLAGTSEHAKNPEAAGNPQVPETSGRNRILPNSIGFVAGFTLLFLLLGAAAASLGGFLRDNRLLLQKAGGLIMILFGLNFTGLFKLGFLNREKRFHLNVEKLNFFKSVLFGMIFGLGWTPCLGAFLGSALLLAGSSATIPEGMLLLFVYSVGLGIPFILSAAIFENVRGVLSWLNRHGRLIGILSGILLIAAGLLIFFDILKYL